MGRKPWGSSAWAIHLESHEPQKAVPAALVAEDSGAVPDAATELLEVFLDGDVQMEWFFLLGARPLLGVGMDPGFLAGHDAIGEAVRRSPFFGTRVPSDRRRALDPAGLLNPGVLLAAG